jgi:hypothetical protein
MNSIAKTTLLLTAICFTWTTAVPAEEAGVAPPFPDSAGPEIWIDGPDNVQPDGPNFPDVAVDNEGRRIHVWVAFDVIDRDDVYLRRFDADGNPLEEPKMVNTTIPDLQRYPRVAVSADGSFLVVFQSFESNNFVIRSRAYDANGNPVGGEQLLNTVATGVQVDAYADVAALRTADGSPGGYAVVWRSGTASGGASNGSIEACIVSADGVPGAQFQANSNNGGSEQWPSVTELQDGGFLVVWVNNFVQDVMGRRFNSAGGGIGQDFQINTFDSAASLTDAAIGWNGSVLVVWEDSGVENPPLPGTTNTEIRGRMYDADLGALGDDFRINNLFDGIQDDPRVGDYGPVGFLVVWNSDTDSAGPDTSNSIEARVVSGPNAFDATGDGADEDQVQYNVWDNDSVQWLPGTQGWYGRLATVWYSLSWDGQPPPNDSDNGSFIIGRDIEYCMLCDDFEWFSPASPGSLWRWSSTAGVVP